METLVAFVVVHESVLASPAAMEVGVAVKVAVGAGFAVTVTVACFVLVPPEPVAVSVYVVVTLGLTDVLPLSGSFPRPLSIETDVAPDVVQVSVEDCPVVTEAGLAENETLGAAAVTVTVACFVVVAPPLAVATSVYVVVCVGATFSEPFRTCPCPSIVTVAAPAVVQVSVELCPVTIVVGFAVKDTVGGVDTVIVTCRVIVPPAPLAVSVYVVVAVGDTGAEPESGREPRPLSIVTVVAFVVVHVRVDDWPAMIAVGFAVKLAVGAGLVTVTVTCFVVVPPAPVAVSVYVVVAVGETTMDPFTGWLPIPLSIDTLVAFVVDHVSVEDWPATIDVGLAEKDAVGTGDATVTDTLSKSASPLVELTRRSPTCA